MKKLYKKLSKAGGKQINCSNCLNPWIGHKQTRIGNRYCQRLPDMDRAMLDPLFWQSLGKAMGWKKSDIACNHSYKRLFPDGCIIAELHPAMDGWEIAWHAFVAHLAEGKGIESFFNQF